MCILRRTPVSVIQNETLKTLNFSLAGCISPYIIHLRYFTTHNIHSTRDGKNKTKKDTLLLCKMYVQTLITKLLGLLFGVKELSGVQISPPGHRSELQAGH